jgi:chemotaxis protein methyltransferase CheR
MARSAPRPTLGQEDLDRIRALVRRRTGIAVPEARQLDLERAVRRAVRDLAAEDVADLYRRLQPGEGAEALDALVAALDVTETYFLRDASQVRALADRILPELIASRRPERRLRLWSAGCSTGEEAYTLAILLHGLLPDLRRWDVRILATDVNGRSLRRAARGVYGEWSFRGVPQAVRARHFSPSGDRYEVAAELRDMVTFAKLNLVEDHYPSPLTGTTAMDLILCRNVLLYFDPGTARSVVGRLAETLTADGWLLVSQVEAILGPFEGLEAGMPGAAAYRKAGQPEPAGVLPAAPPPPRPVLTPPAPAVGAHPPAATGAPPPSPGDRPAGCQEALELWRNGCTEDAVRRLDEEAARDPLAPAAHYLLGLIRLDQGRQDEALVSFRRCTCADPGFVLGHLAKAGQLARLGLRAQAKASLGNAERLLAALHPDDPVPHGDGLTARQVLSLASDHRALVEQDRGPRARHG